MTQYVFFLYHFTEARQCVNFEGTLITNAVAVVNEKWKFTRTNKWKTQTSTKTRKEEKNREKVMKKPEQEHYTDLWIYLFKNFPCESFMSCVVPDQHSMPPGARSHFAAQKIWRKNIFSKFCCITKIVNNFYCFYK